MKKTRFLIVTIGLTACFFTNAFCQTEVVEHMPDEAYVVNWQPLFLKKIVSYVQLPGDSLEYKKIKTYVRYRAKSNMEKDEELLKTEDLSRTRYLGAYLVPTGRTFSILIDDSVLGVENTNLNTRDQLMNNETVSVNLETGP
ncbi:hypothetical protein [Dyadobacter sp. CY356]|uniref:hypothetical protein n=1 Tax=Dyadobacter sp. CY356 TaxID=2906442 RepID=UPI001F3E03F9|nr:hypothetical protein [Dyadobacter sp. CY356]MCF0055033.1 hypothetical protein [Dyadobacter sp. CY356]